MLDKCEQRLEPLRSKIKDIDRDLISLIARRRQLSVEVGLQKQRHCRPIGSTDEALRRCVDLGRTEGVPLEIIQKIYEIILKDSVDLQQEILGG